jgi:hypothetical protein
MGDRYGYSNPSRAEIVERREREEKQRQKDIDDIDSEINWAYQQMRIVEHRLEAQIESCTDELCERDQKRLDKALVVTRTGLKMLKKIVKSRAPHIDTAAWRSVVDDDSRPIQ